MDNALPKNTDRVKLFGLLQSLFWFAYWLIWISFRPAATSTMRELFLSGIYFLVLVTWSFVLRFFYKRYHVHHFALSKLTLVLMGMPLLSAFLMQAVLIAYLYVLSGSIPLWIYDTRKFFGGIWDGFSLFLIWSTLYIGFKLYEGWIIERQEVERARSNAQAAQLAVLQYQIHPHFLFNALSSLRALTTTNPPKAGEVVTKIAEFLRYSLTEGNHSDVPLSQEVRAIRDYLEIESLQYEEHLRVEWKIDPLIKKCLIPPFLLHPLVENAVKHGMETSPMPLTISVHAELMNGKLCLRVTNTGKWIDRSAGTSSPGTQTGLANVRKRLQHLYPGAHSFEIIKEDGMVRIAIHLPQRQGVSYDETD